MSIDQSTEDLAIAALATRVGSAMRGCVECPSEDIIDWIVEETLCQARMELHNTGRLMLPGIGTLAYDSDGEPRLLAAPCIDVEDC